MYLVLVSKCAHPNFLRFLIRLSARGLVDRCLPHVRVVPITALRVRWVPGWVGRRGDGRACAVWEHSPLFAGLGRGAEWDGRLRSCSGAVEEDCASSGGGQPGRRACLCQWRRQPLLRAPPLGHPFITCLFTHSPARPRPPLLSALTPPHISSLPPLPPLPPSAPSGRSAARCPAGTTWAAACGTRRRPRAPGTWTASCCTAPTCAWTCCEARWRCSRAGRRRRRRRGSIGRRRRCGAVRIGLRLG